MRACSAPSIRIISPAIRPFASRAVTSSDPPTLSLARKRISLPFTVPVSTSPVRSPLIRLPSCARSSVQIVGVPK